MLIVFATAGLVLAILLYAIVLVGCRNPGKPAWTKDFLVGNLYVPTMIGLLAMSVGCFIQLVLTLGSQRPSLVDWALAAGIAAGGWVLLKSLRVKKHLDDYAAAEMSGNVIRLPKSAAGPTERPMPSEPPVKPTSGKRAA